LPVYRLRLSVAGRRRNPRTRFSRPARIWIRATLTRANVFLKVSRPAGPETSRTRPDGWREVWSRRRSVQAVGKRAAPGVPPGLPTVLPTRRNASGGRRAPSDAGSRHPRPPRSPRSPLLVHVGRTSVASAGRLCFSAPAVFFLVGRREGEQGEHTAQSRVPSASRRSPYRRERRGEQGEQTPRSEG